MRILFSIFIIHFVMTASAETSPRTERFLFEPPKSAGTIAKMQVDLVQGKGRWYANVRSHYRNGTSVTGRLACAKSTSTEFKCRRMDGGGGFELRTSPVPRISLTYFTSDEEGAEIKNFLRAPANETLVIEGNKVSSASGGF